MNRSNHTALHNSSVVQAVREGLMKKHKTLPSWLYYDEVGDKLFQQIMFLSEYYLTRCELEILRDRKEDIFRLLERGNRSFKVVELGAGDGIKTEILLRYFTGHSMPFTYVPVDISLNVLDQLVDRLDKDMPDLDIQPQNKSYYDALKSINADDGTGKLILFLGGNIGNFTLAEVHRFMQQLALNMGPDDYLLIGFDLKKDPTLIQAAYSDKKGVTRAFNMNLLDRLNRELGAQFVTNQFGYYSSYDPNTGTVKNYLISKQEQEVLIPALGSTVHFDKWENIYTETSQKYDIPMIETLVTQVGLSVADIFYDRKKYFCNVMIRL